MTPVNSTTVLEITAVYNKPEIQCSGDVIASGIPVQHAPVDIISDYRSTLRRTADTNGDYQTRIRLTPGMHRIQAQFVNATYPVFSSKSQVYLVEAGPDSILSVRLPDMNMSADELSLNLDPATASYQDVITITGALSGKNPGNRTVDLFIDSVFSHALKTRPDGSYAEKYTIDKIRSGTHTLFSRYSEPDIGELYSESRQVTIKNSDTVTNLGIMLADGGTSVICTGNVSVNGHGTSSVPVELVWDNRNIIELHTDIAGSFHQKISLPAGNHTIFARFTSQDFPLNPSQSRVYPVEVLPPLDLRNSPETVQYLDALTIGGSIHGVNSSGREIWISIDGKRTILLRSGPQGRFSTSYLVENISAGEHTVRAFSEAHSSALQRFFITPVASNLSLSIEKIPDSYQVTCTGFLAAQSRPVRNAPVLIISDDHTVFDSTTNRYGQFEATVTLPAGIHRIRTVFNSTSEFPLSPSESQTIEIEIPRLIIPGNLTLNIIPHTGKFGETMNFSGTLSARQHSGEQIQIFIDGKNLMSTTTDPRGNYSFQYVIDRLSSGSHSVDASSKTFRSDIDTVHIIPADSVTTLSVYQIPGTPRISCSGTVTANNRSLRLAPVTIIIDEKDYIRTETDESGYFREIITQPAGKHRIQASFNSSEIFPVNPSVSIPAEIEISPLLSLAINPSSGTYKDTFTFEGTLISPDTLENPVDIFIDNSLLATVKTNNTGRYTFNIIVEQISSGTHVAQVRSADRVSGNRTFQVDPVYSRTSFSIAPVNQSALYECTGQVMAFDHAGDIVRKPVTLQDARLILAEIGKNPLESANRPVVSAPVIIIANNKTLLETRTGTDGNFSALVAFPEGDNVIAARFINTSYPIFSSESRKMYVNIPSANISLTTEIQQSPIRILAPLAVIAILFLFAGGAVYYLKRKSVLFRERQVPSGTGEKPDSSFTDLYIRVPESFRDTQHLPEDLPGSDLNGNDPIFTRYLRILQAEGLSTAARSVYLHFTGTIAQSLHIRNHRTLTPREFLRSCDEKPFTGPFSSFIVTYEQIRYGGVSSPEKQDEFEDSVQVTGKLLEGEDH